MAKELPNGDNLRAALHERYPQYNEKQIKKLATLVLKEIAQAVLQGKHITFIKFEGGEITLDALYVEDETKK
jgi:nucleoid DNA-binding protein